MADSTSQIILDQLWASMLANSSVASVVKPGNRINYESVDRVVREQSRSNPGDFPTMKITETTQSQEDGPTTFGRQKPTATLDYKVPIDMTFEVKIVFDQVQGSPIRELEKEVNSVLTKLHIDLGTAGHWWVGKTSFRKTKRDERGPETGNVLRPVTIYALRVQGRRKLSTLTA